jgi:hypothetical protein
MANVLTNLIPNVFVALDVVSRELTGMIPSVTLDARSSQAAVGQTVYSNQAPAATGVDLTPAATQPTAADQTQGAVPITIQKVRGSRFYWTGEEQGAVAAPGVGALTMAQAQIAQAIRTLTNELEADLTALHNTTSRAFGTAGTTPFATAGDFSDVSNAAKILKDNGAPTGDMQLVLNTTAGAAYVGKNSRYDIQGDRGLLQQGLIGFQGGMQIRESGQIVNFTKGTGASATVNNAGYAVGATVLTLSSAGTGTILAGDVVTFAGDSNQYVVVSGDADVSGGGTITIAEPGLRVAMSAATKAITIVNSSARNMVFSRSALVLAARAPKRPEQGDQATAVEYITDPRTGLTFELAYYPQFMQGMYQLGLAWGVKNIKPAHTGLLLG